MTKVLIKYLAEWSLGLRIFQNKVEVGYRFQIVIKDLRPDYNTSQKSIHYHKRNFRPARLDLQNSDNLVFLDSVFSVK